MTQKRYFIVDYPRGFTDDQRKADEFAETMWLRNVFIVYRREQGDTLEKIGARCGLSRARVNDVIHQMDRRMRYKLAAENNRLVQLLPFLTEAIK